MGCLLTPLEAGLVFTEIHYHPSVVDDPSESLEFVEIRNNTAHPADLSGYHFASGIRFEFPENFLLPAWEHIVVCANVDRVQEHYGIENAIGNFEGRLDNDGEELQLANRAGSIVARVRYNDRGRWPREVDGTGHTLVVRQSLLDVSTPENWTYSPQQGGTPGIENFPPPLERREPVFPGTGPEALWRYKPGWNNATRTQAEFSDPPSAWFAEDFDDSEWALGEAPIGTGEDEIVTLLENFDRTYVSFAARRRFTVTQDQHDRAEGFVLAVGIDDGGVFFLNGVEVARSSIEGDPGTPVPAAMLANRTTELRRTIELTVSKEALRVGENVLAVQVHNRSLASRDLALSVELQLRFREFFAGPPEPALRINEVVTRSPDGRHVELHNSLDTAMDLSGYRLCDSPAQNVVFGIPEGTMVPGGEFVSFPESALGFALDSGSVDIFLYGPPGHGVVDAVRVSDPEFTDDPVLSHARFPDGAEKWWISTVATPAAANEVPLEDGLIVNEINYAPRSLGPDGKPLAVEEATEFLEIYNRSPRAISLAGIALDGGYNYAFDAGRSLLPGEYLVIGPNPTALIEIYSLDPSQVLGPSPAASEDEIDEFGRLRNSGECVRLIDRLGNPIDEVCYRDGGDWDELADGGGSTLELVDPAQDNSVGTAWEASDESVQSEWTEFVYEREHLSVGPGRYESEVHLFLLSSGECLIDELSVVSPLPEGADPEHTPDRVRNGDFEEDTSPWRLWGNHVHSFRTTDDAHAGSASLHLVATGPGNNKANRLETDVTPAFQAGSVTVRFWAKWLRGSNALHVSGHNNSFGNTVHLPVPQATGTPGAENRATAFLREETGAVNSGPVLSRPAHSPAVPNLGDTIQFRVCASDSDGVASVRVSYRETREEEWRSAVLLDTGPLAAGRDGDGFFAVDVPPEPEHGVIDFWFEATDALGNVSTYPRGGPDAPLSFVVSAPVQTEVATRFRVVMGHENVRELSTRLLHSNDSLPATFILEEQEVFYNVGVRYHGSPWGRPSNPKSFRVNFNGDRPFMGGAKRMNISGRVKAQAEPTAYHFLERASTVNAVVPYSPQFQYLRVWFNTRPHNTGPMVEVRAIDSTYADFHWPDDSDGVVSKITGKLAFNDQGLRGADPTWSQFKVYDAGVYVGDHLENYRFFYNPKTRRDEDPFEDLMRMLNVMDRKTTPDPDRYLEEIENVINVEAFLRDYIVRILQDDWDTIDIGNGQNAYLYYAPNEGKHYLVPWDMDNTFGSTNARLTPLSTTFGVGRLISFPRYRRLYGNIMMELTRDFWNVDHIVEWASLVNHGAPFSEIPTGSAVISFVRGRTVAIDRFLGGALEATFEITTPDPDGIAGSSTVVEGVAPLSVTDFIVRVNGELTPSAVEWNTDENAGSGRLPTRWSLPIDTLEPGENTVEVLAFDAAGELIGAGNVRLFNTTGWSDPTLEAIEPPAGPEGGGTVVTLKGSGFQPHTEALIHDLPLENIEIISPTELQGVSPRGPQDGGTADVVVRLVDGREARLSAAFTYTKAAFRRGDADGDGVIGITDPLVILEALFRGGDLGCADAADANDDGRLSLVDPIHVLDVLFRGRGSLPEPFEALGPDPTADRLLCNLSQEG